MYKTLFRNPFPIFDIRSTVLICNNFEMFQSSSVQWEDGRSVWPSYSPQIIQNCRDRRAILTSTSTSTTPPFPHKWDDTLQLVLILLTNIFLSRLSVGPTVFSAISVRMTCYQISQLRPCHQYHHHCHHHLYLHLDLPLSDPGGDQVCGAGHWRIGDSQNLDLYWRRLIMGGKYNF